MITFSTKNWHDLTYLQAQGEQMLHLMGCHPIDENTGRAERGGKAQGIVQADDVARVLSRLQQVSVDEAHLEEQLHYMEMQKLDGQRMPKLSEEPPISLTARVFPLLQLLQSAREADQSVVWRHSTVR
jgi:hypothetical protein